MEGSVVGLVRGMAIERMPGVEGLCRGCERLHAKFSRSAALARPGMFGSRAFRASDSSARLVSISAAASSVSPSSSSLLCTRHTYVVGKLGRELLRKYGPGSHATVLNG